MKYYATIYIDEFLEYEILVSLYNGMIKQMKH